MGEQDEINPGTGGFEDNSAPVADSDNGPSINPAWSPLLEQLPESLHNIAIPHLQKWDSGVQEMVGKVHSQYEPYKPFLEQNLDPASLYQGYQIQQALEADPAKFIEAVMDFYKIAPVEQGQQPEESGEEEPAYYDVNNDPEFQRIKGMSESMAQLILAQQQQQQESTEDSQLDADLDAARQELGEFDEDYVLQRMIYFEEDPRTAVQSYHQFVQDTITQSRNPSASAPVIMGSGGGTPVQPTAVNNMQPQDRRALIAQMLATANAQGG